jgi:hypothetical protein
MWQRDVQSADRLSAQLAMSAQATKYFVRGPGPSPAFILGGLMAGVAGAGVLFHLTRNMKVFGGSTPRTITDEWAKATHAKRMGKALESGGAVMSDPISHFAYGSNK